MSDVAMVDASQSSQEITGTKKRKMRTSSTMTDIVSKVSGNGTTVAIPRAVPHVYNDKYTVMLTYADSFQSQHLIGSGTPIFNYFRLFSIFDPDINGVGHQPHGRDMWASMYNFYTVLYTDLEFTFYNTSHDVQTFTAAGTSQQSLCAAIVNIRESTSASEFAINNAVFPGSELKNTVTKIIPPANSSSDCMWTYKRRYYPDDFQIETRDADADRTWTGVGANPPVDRLVGFDWGSLCQSAPVGLSEPSYTGVIVYVKLDMCVQFTEVNASNRTISS